MPPHPETIHGAFFVVDHNDDDYDDKRISSQLIHALIFFQKVSTKHFKALITSHFIEGRFHFDQCPII